MRNHHEELIAAPAILAGVAWIWNKLRRGAK
jgi:hypothetical protein